MGPSTFRSLTCCSLVIAGLGLLLLLFADTPSACAAPAFWSRLRVCITSGFREAVDSDEVPAPSSQEWDDWNPPSYVEDYATLVKVTQATDLEAKGQLRAALRVFQDLEMNTEVNRLELLLSTRKPTDHATYETEIIPAAPADALTRQRTRRLLKSSMPYEMNTLNGKLRIGHASAFLEAHGVAHRIRERAPGHVVLEILPGLNTQLNSWARNLLEKQGTYLVYDPLTLETRSAAGGFTPSSDFFSGKSVIFFSNDGLKSLSSHGRTEMHEMRHMWSFRKSLSGLPEESPGGSKEKPSPDSVRSEVPEHGEATLPGASRTLKTMRKELGSEESAYLVSVREVLMDMRKARTPEALESFRRLYADKMGKLEQALRQRQLIAKDLADAILESGSPVRPGAVQEPPFYNLSSFSEFRVGFERDVHGRIVGHVEFNPLHEDSRYDSIVPLRGSKGDADPRNMKLLERAVDEFRKYLADQQAIFETARIYYEDYNNATHPAVRRSILDALVRLTGHRFPVPGEPGYQPLARTQLNQFMVDLLVRQIR